MGRQIKLSIVRLRSCRKHSALANGWIFHPLQCLRYLIERTDLRNHYAAAARFHRSHDRRIIGRSNSSEGVKTSRPTCNEHELQLGVRVGAMFKIDPEAMKIAERAGHFNQFRGSNASKVHCADQLAG